MKKIINKAGFYLVLEGVDFTGKSSLANELVKRLKKKYGDEFVCHRREPSHSNYGLKMREILFSKELTQEKEILAAQYMLMDRIDNTSKVSQLLRENKIVIQERNFLTALVYNEAKDANEVKFIQEINKLSLKPDYLALLTISNSELKNRIEKARVERGELDNYETYEKTSFKNQKYITFKEHIDAILRNETNNDFEKNLSFLEDLIGKNYNIER